MKLPRRAAASRRREMAWPRCRAWRPWAARVLACAVVAGVADPVAGADTMVVASKSFRESYVLGEALTELLRRRGFPARHEPALGGTKICYDALVAGEVDVYVEYTGTIAEGIKRVKDPTWANLTVALAADEVEMLPTFGFNNTYVLAVLTATAQARNLTTISDLAGHPDMRVAVSHEFLDRADGWRGLRRLYDLPQTPSGIEHSLAYRAIADGAIDLTDGYSTDGELAHLPLTALEDDRGFFPVYLAVPLVRADLPPRARAVLMSVVGTLDENQMRAMNAAAMDDAAARRVAREYVAKIAAPTGAGEPAAAPPPHLWRRIGANTARHLVLVLLALLPAVVVAVLAAILIFKVGWMSRSAVYFAGLLQTIPSIALLALLIPLLGIGPKPAVVALFLYALLPILRNAVTALGGIDPTLRRVATAIGLKPIEELRLVFVPLAMPAILAGVRTATVVTIGTATLAAFIGAGGLGEPIVTGLALNDTGLILEGAIPAALLAVATELLFEQVERTLVPGHLRIATAG